MSHLIVKEQKTIIRNAFFTFIYFTLAIGLAIGILYTDIFYLQNMIEEESLVEYTQSLSLTILTLMFSRHAYRSPQWRGGFVLITGFFLCMLIRESDAIFDNLIRHGSWAYFAITTALVCIIYAFTHRQSTIDGLAQFAKQKEFHSFIIGLLTVLLASRLIGYGGLWRFILYNDYPHVVKNIIEETTELFGYLIMLFSCLSLTRHFK